MTSLNSHCIFLSLLLWLLLPFKQLVETCFRMMRYVVFEVAAGRREEQLLPEKSIPAQRAISTWLRETSIFLSVSYENMARGGVCSPSSPSFSLCLRNDRRLAVSSTASRESLQRLACTPCRLAVMARSLTPIDVQSIERISANPSLLIIECRHGFLVTRLLSKSSSKICAEESSASDRLEAI